MHLTQFNNIVTKVSSRKKGATTFGDLPDCLLCVYDMWNGKQATENKSMR